MNSQDFVKFAFQIAVMLGCAMLFGQIMRRVRQPGVLGEMIGGILLGPTLLGVLLGARLAGMALDRERWAIGFGLNARGATGIILAGVGRAAGVIDDGIFVAIVVMALVTSLIAGPMMSWLLSHRFASLPTANTKVIAAE